MQLNHAVQELIACSPLIVKYREIIQVYNNAVYSASNRRMTLLSCHSTHSVYWILDWIVVPKFSVSISLSPSGEFEWADATHWVTQKDLQGDGWEFHSLDCFLWISMTFLILLLCILSSLCRIFTFFSLTPWPKSFNVLLLPMLCSLLLLCGPLAWSLVSLHNVLPVEVVTQNLVEYSILLFFLYFVFRVNQKLP